MAFGGDELANEATCLAHLRADLEVLKAVEWNGIDDSWSHGAGCPLCMQRPPYPPRAVPYPDTGPRGHTDDCALDARIKALEDLLS